MDICPKCGLPLQACVCEDIAKTEQNIQIQTAKKRFGKLITELSGFQGVDLKTLAKNLKQELACGGTVKENTVELQGDHSRTAKNVLVKLGFSEDAIEIM
ncbi:stress response translation initiation inhibitor YciH [archaeon]|jgi:translation initiation factor 1|nr:stress response translation initiation inhibitor YciH [archaeon]MBT4242112.1 stress response translation initiation inhibitor YciH [archaeon]MBT4417800.1 stress response translation initiation inhibitor YciH [archaeon]